MARRADPSKWDLELDLEGKRATITLPADDVLGKRRPDGKRPYKMPMRKIVEKLKQRCPGRGWDFSTGKYNEDGKTCTFVMMK
jgi:hypothetical protein